MKGVVGSPAYIVMREAWQILHGSSMEVFPPRFLIRFQTAKVLFSPLKGHRHKICKSSEATQTRGKHFISPASSLQIMEINSYISRLHYSFLRQPQAFIVRFFWCLAPDGCAAECDRTAFTSL